MARPKKKVRPKVYRFSITCTPGIDDDLITFFDSLEAGEGAAEIMTALRQGGVTSTTINDHLDENELLDSLDDFILD